MNSKCQQKFFHDFVQTYSGLKLNTAQWRGFMLLKLLEGITCTSTKAQLVKNFVVLQRSVINTTKRFKGRANKTKSKRRVH